MSTVVNTTNTRSRYTLNLDRFLAICALVTAIVFMVTGKELHFLTPVCILFVGLAVLA